MDNKKDENLENKKAEKDESEAKTEKEEKTENTDKNSESKDKDSAEKTSDEEFEKLQNELKKTNESYIRLAAEYDNYRKRTTKEKTNIYNDAIAKAIENILPVLDNFELALKTPCDDEKFLKGIQMIEGQFEKILSDMGVSEIKAIGEKFDPNIHHAIKQVDDSDKESDTVIEVFQKGYMIGDRLIRPAMVSVAN